MSREDPKQPRSQRHLVSYDEESWRRGVTPGTSPDELEEDAPDETTWAAAGNPYGTREHTAEVSYYEETETNIDWNGPSVPGMPSEDTLNFETRSAAGEGGLGEYATEPGFGTDAGQLSALRDAMRPAPRGRAPAVLPLPPPRARTNPGVRLPPATPPIRRAAPAPLPTEAVPPPAPRPRTPPARKRNASPAATIVPIATAAVLVLVLGVVAVRMMAGGFGGGRDADVAAPMLPVVGGPAPTEWPPPPFDIPAPQPFRPDLIGTQVDLAGAPTRITELAAAGEVEHAAALADRYVRTENQASMFFELGALLAAAGDVDSALYWVVRSSQEAGFPPSRLVQRQEFHALWADPRWDAFVRWAVMQARFYAGRAASPATVVTPSSLEAALALDAARKGGKAGKKQGGRPELPVLIWLDQVGGNGSSVLAWGQKVADELGVVVVGLGGPERVGPSGSWWSSDPARDREHVIGALASIPNLEADPERRYLVGLGQGAQYAVELVLRDPGFAAGALALSPTDDWTGKRDTGGEGRKERDQEVTLATGALVPAVHTLLRLDHGRLQRAKVRSTMTIEKTPWAWPDHAPADVGGHVASWLAARLSPGGVAAPVDAAATTDAAPATATAAEAQAAPVTAPN